MNIYVFPYISNLTERYHSGGGLVVVARDRDHVLELIHTEYDPDDYWNDNHQTTINESEWDKVVIYPTDPNADPKAYFFANAGCCQL